MTTQLARRMQVAIETEVTSGTGVTLIAGDVRFRVKPGAVFNVENDTIPQDLLQTDLSELPDLIGNRPVTMTFETLLAGSGAAGTAAGWREIMIHAGFDEVVAGSSVTYNPETPASVASATVGLHVGASFGGSGRLYRMKGARVESLVLSFTAGQPWSLATTWKGAFLDATDSAEFAGVTYDATVPQTARSLSLTIGSFTPLFRDFTLNVSNTLAMIENPGDASEPSGISHFEIAGRRMDGSLTVLEPLVSEKDIFADLFAGTTAAFSATLGATAGNIVTLTAPAFQFLTRGQGETEGILSHTENFKLCRSAGDDEVRFVTT